MRVADASGGRHLDVVVHDECFAGDGAEQRPLSDTSHDAIVTEEFSVREKRPRFRGVEDG